MTIVPRPPGRPDLAVASLAVSDAGPGPRGGASRCRRRCATRATGTRRARRCASTARRIRRSPRPTPRWAQGAAAPLAASGSSAESVTLTAPTVPGTYWYGACVKAVAEETDTADNCSASVQVTVTAPPATSTPPPAETAPAETAPAETAPAETAPAETAPGPAGDSPDLMVTRIAASAHSPASGTSFTLSVTVRNDGDGDAPSTTLRFYRSADPTITTSGTEVGTSAVAPLAASASSEAFDLADRADSPRDVLVRGLREGGGGGDRHGRQRARHRCRSRSRRLRQLRRHRRQLRRHRPRRRRPARPETVRI